MGMTVDSLIPGQWFRIVGDDRLRMLVLRDSQYVSTTVVLCEDGAMESSIIRNAAEVEQLSRVLLSVKEIDDGNGKPTT